MTDQDIAIIGGGLVGLSAALALQSSNRRIHIIEAGMPEQSIGTDVSGLDARSIALSYSSVQIFKALGVWKRIKKHAVAIKHIHVSARGYFGVTRLNADSYNLDALGYVIENMALIEGLQAAVKESSLITLQTGAEFDGLDTDSRPCLRYRYQGDSCSVEANLVLVIDGAGSQARAGLGIEHRSVDYDQNAIITNLKLSKPVAATAYERFTDDGPLAMLPLSRNRYACVWTQKPAKASILMALDDEKFSDRLQRYFGFRLGYIEQVGRRFSFPVQRIEAQSLVRQRCVLLGNAANALHPVAGQGFNLALRDIAELQNLFAGEEIASIDNNMMDTLLERYEDSRSREQRRVIRLGDGLVNLFSNSLPLVTHARAGALALLDLIPPLKADVAFSGMGLSAGGNAMLRGCKR